MVKQAILPAVLIIGTGCGSTREADRPPVVRVGNVAVVSDQICSTDQANYIESLQAHSLGASVTDTKGSCVHEFEVNKSVAPWVPMLAREQVFCGNIERYSASNSTVGGIFDRDNDVNVYVDALPGPSKDIYDFAVAFWGVTPEFAEMEVTVPEPLRHGNSFFPQPWTAGRLDHMVEGPHCFYGPWVSDNSHPGGPAHAEIHPVKASWWRDGDDLVVFSIQDESARFDQCISYQPVANPLCRVAEEHRADCFVADGDRVTKWGREWTRGPLELEMQYLIDIPSAAPFRSLRIETLDDREVVTHEAVATDAGPLHYLVNATGDTMLVLREDVTADPLLAVDFDMQASCWSADRESLHAVVNLTWALGNEAKWEYGIDRGWNWWAPNPQSGRGYLAFRVTEAAPIEAPAMLAVTRGLSPAQIDSLRARLLGLTIRWQDVAGQNMPVADITIATNLEEEYGTREIESSMRGLRGIDPPGNVTANPDTSGVWTIRNVPLLFGGRVRLARADSAAPDSDQRALNINLPSYRMSAGILDVTPLEHRAPEAVEPSWRAFLNASGGVGGGGPPPPSFRRVIDWRILVQSRLVPLLEDLDVDVTRWRDRGVTRDGSELTIPPETPFPDLTSFYAWRVTAADAVADSAVAVVERPLSGPVRYATDDPDPSIGAVDVHMTGERPPLVRVAIEYDAADTFGNRSIGDAFVYSLAFVDADAAALRRDILVAAVDAEQAGRVDWIRAAVDFARNGDANTLTDPSESLLILAGSLAADGIVDLDEFEHLRRAITRSTQ